MPEPSFSAPDAAVVRDRLVDLQRLRATLGQFTFDLDRPLVVEPGQLVAVVGHNGAGKSFFLEMLAGYHRPDLAEGQVLGRSIGAVATDLAAKRRVGIQLQRNSWPQGVSVGDLMLMHQRLYPVHDVAVGEALDVPALAPLRYGVLSRGQKQRVDLFLALAHRPVLTLLDEPASGLDANYTQRLRTVIAGRGEGALLVALHEDSGLAAADAVLWLQSGKVVATGPREEVVRNYVGTHHVRFEFAAEDEAIRAEALLAGQPGVLRLMRDEATLDAFGDGSLAGARAMLPASPLGYSEGQATPAHFLSLVGRAA